MIIGFLKEVFKVNFCGFCVYYKNRLIMVSFGMLNMLVYIFIRKGFIYWVGIKYVVVFLFVWMCFI